MSIFCALVVVAGGLSMLCPWGCTPHTENTAGGLALENRTIRVRLLQTIDQISLAAAQPPIYFTSADPTPRLLNLPANSPMALTLVGGEWRIGSVSLGRGDLTLRPASAGSVSVNNLAYRGQYRFVCVLGGKFDLINDVELDDYLMSVVSRELFPGWHEAAYRAQTIAARTYALYEKNFPREPRQWDVYADQRSQVYGGLSAESPKSQAAVDATRGIVLAYGLPGEERIFKAYFSSCCGGVSQNVNDVFGTDSYIPPLRAQNVGGLCSASTRYNWGPVVVTKQELTRRFRLWGAARNRAEKDMGLVQSIEIEAVNSFRRPIRYRITDARGLRYSLGCEEFRWAVNTNPTDNVTLSSSYVENVINESDRIRFVGGHGFGHGVGMCQWCAEARARAGISHEDILIYAYPDARLVRAY